MAREAGEVRRLLVLVLLLAACTSTTTTSANVPPPGQIWFGSSFDPKTGVVSGRTDTVGSNAPFSFVAHLAKPTDGAKLVIRTYWSGKLVGTTPSGLTGNSDVWGFTPGPLGEPGAWRYELTDVGGNVLASGTITAT